jgi:hypothetical protein
MMRRCMEMERRSARLGGRAAIAEEALLETEARIIGGHNVKIKQKEHVIEHEWNLLQSEG